MKTMTSQPKEDYTEISVVYGSVVKSRFFIRDVVENIRNFMGWELKSYNKMMVEGRQLALERMCEQGQKLGADAIVGVRFFQTVIAMNAAETLAYGTAIKFGK